MLTPKILCRHLFLMTIGCILTTMLCIRSGDAASKKSDYAYQEIDQLYKEVSKNNNSTRLTLLIEKSRAFIDQYPKHKEIDRVYYILGSALIRANKMEEGIQTYSNLIKDYPTTTYIAPALLEMGLAYDRLGQHSKADEAYQQLINHPKYGSKSFAKAARELLALDKAQRTGQLMLGGQGGSPSDPRVGKPAIDFHEKDLNGNDLSLEKYRGKVILLDFWAVWCGPCRAEMPNVKSVYAKYKDQNFQIVGISLDQDRSKLVAYMKEQGITWPQFFDGNGWENKIAQMYQVNSIPRMYLIDGEGVIRKADVRGPALEPAVAELIRENNTKLTTPK